MKEFIVILLYQCFLVCHFLGISHWAHSLMSLAIDWTEASLNLKRQWRLSKLNSWYKRIGYIHKLMLEQRRSKSRLSFLIVFPSCFSHLNSTGVKYRSKRQDGGLKQFRTNNISLNSTHVKLSKVRRIRPMGRFMTWRLATPTWVFFHCLWKQL